MRGDVIIALVLGLVIGFAGGARLMAKALLQRLAEMGEHRAAERLREEEP